MTLGKLLWSFLSKHPTLKNTIKSGLIDLSQTWGIFVHLFIRRRKLNEHLFYRFFKKKICYFKWILVSWKVFIWWLGYECTIWATLNWTNCAPDSEGEIHSYPGALCGCTWQNWLQSWTKELRDHAWVTFNDRNSEFEVFCPFRNLSIIKMLKDRATTLSPVYFIALEITVLK